MPFVLNRIARFVRLVPLATALTLLTGVSACSTSTVLISAIGIATDTSASWSIFKHVQDKLSEGGPTPCHRLDSVERALALQCQPYAAGSIQAADLVATRKLPLCPLATAARDTRLWPVLPELIERGAMPEVCARSPLLELAQVDVCPDFAAASPAVREAIVWLAQADAHAIHHDVVRMLSCPSARAAGLDAVLERWVAQGEMPPGRLGFSPLSALHPGMLGTPLSAQLEAQGHVARAGLDPFDGALRPGFEAAFRSSDYAALDWWLARVPELANRVPPPQGNQLPWLPLAKALSGGWLDGADEQRAMVEYLLAHGANASARLPYQPDLTVLRLAQQIGSPLLPLLEHGPQPASRMLARGGG